MLLLMHHVTLIPTQYWMTSVAVYLSGHEMPYSWQTSERTD